LPLPSVQGAQLPNSCPPASCRQILRRLMLLSSGRYDTLMRGLITLTILLLLASAAHSQAVPGPCNNTSYGAGVRCVSGAGNGSGGVSGGARQAVNSWSVSYSPHCTTSCNGHAIILTAYFCWDGATCTATGGLVSMTVSTTGSFGTHDPEPCFVESPHSPFILSGFASPNTAPQTVEQAMWVCENVPSGTTSFTVNTSSLVWFLAPSVTEWTGLATSGNPWDVDGGQIGRTLVSSLTATTPATNYTNELIYIYTDSSQDEVMTPNAPCSQVMQWWQGNFNEAYLAPDGGQPVSCSAHWSGNAANPSGLDGWYATIGAIKTAQSQLKTTVSPPSGLTATVQ